MDVLKKTAEADCRNGSRGHRTALGDAQEFALCKLLHRAAIRWVYFIHTLSWAVDLMLCDWMSGLGRKVSPLAPLHGLWSCPHSPCYTWYALQINRFLPQRSLCSGGSSYLWTYLNYPHLGKWIPSAHSHLSEAPCPLSHTLVSLATAAHPPCGLFPQLGKPAGSPGAAPGLPPGSRAAAQCPSRGGGPLNVTLFSWSGACQTYVPSKVLALTWETGGTLLAFSKGALLICCVI